MRPQKILDTDMISGLTKVFRDKGYEGTSLIDLAEVTGLKKKQASIIDFQMENRRWQNLY